MSAGAGLVAASAACWALALCAPNNAAIDTETKYPALSFMALPPNADMLSAFPIYGIDF
jgi:hypothetical protein